MAAFTGIIPPGIETGFPASRPAWLMAQTILVTTSDGFLASNPPGEGSLTQVPPDYAESNYTGVLGGGYGDIFYNRLLLEPSNIDLGNLVSGQTRTVTVFNGHFSQRTLEAVVASGDDDVTLTGDLPPPDVIYGVLQERTYNLDVAIDGPPSINAQFMFNFQGAEQPVLTVTGSRIVILPYYIDAPANESLEWSTNVFTSVNGTEQRVRNRTLPRQSFSVTASIIPSELTRSENLLYGWRDRFWALPTWTEGRTASPVTDTESTITVDTRYGDFRVGGLAMIWKSPRVFDVFEILSLTDTTLVLDRTVNADYLSGFVMPIRIARLIGDPVRNTTGFNGDIQGNFTVRDNPTYTPKIFDVSETFNGVDVYLQQPLRNPDSVTDSYRKRTDLVDFRTGTVEIFAPWTYTKINREFLLQFASLEEVWDFKSFLASRQGRLKSFYMPTFESNLRLLSTGLVTTPLIVGSDATATQGSDRVTIAVNTTTGWLFRSVTGYSVDIDGNTLVAISSPLNIDSSEINYISYMGLKRLTSDTIRINWLPNYVAQVVVPITEIQP